MKLAITICATKSYAYAAMVQARRLQAALNYVKINDPYIILVSDQSDCLDKVQILYKSIVPKADVLLIKMDIDDGHKNYKEAAQLTIAQMRTVAFSKARELNVDYCFSLDSDILPGINSIQCSLDILNFDHGYYSVACPLYMSQGGGSYLCGHGTPERPILSDFLPDERIVPKRYIRFKEKYQKKLKSFHPKNQAQIKLADKVIKKLLWVEKRIERYPPKSDIFTLNGKGKWRRRGWFDYAYPAIGKGAVVPSDWCGFGATMMNRKALELAIFDGYDGRGTEDLYICFNRWYPNNLKIAAIPHSVCDHIIRSRNNPKEYLHIQAYHENSGEFINHLRQRSRPFYTMEEGEKFQFNKNKELEFSPITRNIDS